MRCQPGVSKDALAFASFELLLLAFAVDAELGHGSSLDALDADVLAAGFALAKDPVLDLFEGLID